MQPRVPTHRYTDPLDRIWLGTATRIGLDVRRTGEAYASTSGDGHLLLADAPHLDPDDSLAQMIFHELCHSLVQGEDSFRVRDWGLDNETPEDVPREEACLRVQATLAARHGLRRFFAPTTDFRAFYDALPEDALAPRWDPTIVLAVSGVRRADKAPWAPHLAAALEATRVVAAEAARFAGIASLVSEPSDTRPDAPELGDASKPARSSRSQAVPAPRTPEPVLADLWSRVDPVPNRHPSGLPGVLARSDRSRVGLSGVASEGAGAPTIHTSPVSETERTCGNCAWRAAPQSKCRQADVRIRAEWPGCERWEAALDCQECGACCRAAYDLVQVSPRDPVRKKHPELVVLRGPYLEIVRNGDRCAALGGGTAKPGAHGSTTFEPYACAIYEDRPKSCRDFANGGEHCLTARRRVGLSL